MRNRDPQFLLAAALLHAALIAAAWVTGLSTRSAGDPGLPAGTAGQERGELAFDLVPEAPAKSPAEQPLARITPVPAPHVGRSAPRARTPEAPENDAPYPEPAPSANAPAGAQEGLDQKPPPPAPLPGLDGKPVWSLPGVLPSPALAGRVSPGPPPTPEAPSPSLPLGTAGQAVLDYLGSGTPPPPSQTPEPVQHFPAAGTLASAVAEEVRSSSAPPESDTVFELVVDAQGHVASVHVIAVDPDHRKAAEGAARAVAKRFSGQTLPLPGAFAGGSRIRVSVQSRLAMPDGSKHGIPMPRPSLPGAPSPYAIKEDSRDDRHRPGSMASLPPPKLGIALSFDFDLANIGAKRRRVVHTRFHAVPLAGAPSGTAKQ